MTQITMAHSSAISIRARFIAYVELLKPRIAMLVIVAAGLGFLLGHKAPMTFASWGQMLITVLGVLLVGGGANVLNQYLEADYDRLMDRTRNRPIPAGRIQPAEALAYGVACSAVGIILLALLVNLLAAAVAAIALGGYVFVYTPSKRLSPMCVYVGAVPGALPPVIGYVGASGTMTIEAWFLFGILFLWQLPHFLAIAWLYRDDYRAAGYPMLTVVDDIGDTINLHMISHTLALWILTLLPLGYQLAGPVYGVGAAVLGGLFLLCGICFVIYRSRAMARFHLLASVTYLPLLLGCMVVDRWLFPHTM